jgi:hypothetical protein
MKHCGRCGQDKPLVDFPRDSSKRDSLNSACRVCVSKKGRHYREAKPETVLETKRRYRESHVEELREQDRVRHAAEPEKFAARYREWHEALRAKVFDHYGWACACCGTSENLTVDHIHGDGAQHRAEIGPGSDRIYYWLVSNDFPPGFQTLCNSCNSSKSDGERCRLNHSAA